MKIAVSRSEKQILMSQIPRMMMLSKIARRSLRRMILLISLRLSLTRTCRQARPKITGEADEEMVESELFQPETTVAHVDDAPTLEDNKANEAGVLGFLARMYEYKILMPRYSGDVILQEDHEEELSKTPFRVIDENYA